MDGVSVLLVFLWSFQLWTSDTAGGDDTGETGGEPGEAAGAQ